MIIESSWGSFAQPSYGVQCSIGFTYSLVRNSCLNTGMWGECTLCDRGAEFLPRGSARRIPNFFSRSFSSPTRCTGLADSPPVDGKLLMQLVYHGELLTPPRFCFMVVLPFFLYWGGISLNYAIFLILQGQLLFPSFSCFGRIVILAGWGSFAVFHWTLQCFFSLQSQLLPPRCERGSLA